jgi:inhibitor of growth protein 3
LLKFDESCPQNAEECYNLVDRYLRKLDQELHKFKMELEADNRGITEVLEKRSLEMDAPAAGTAKENRLPKKHVSCSWSEMFLKSWLINVVLNFQNRKTNQTIVHGGGGGAGGSLGLVGGGGLGGMPKMTADRKGIFPGYSETLLGLDANLAASAAASSLLSSPATPGPSSSTYPLQHMGAGGNAIAAAASQAIAATQQLVPGRRTSSLKASYEAIHLGLQANEFTIGRDLAAAAQSALAATAFGTGGDSPIQSTSSGGCPPPSKRQKTNKRGHSIDPGTPQPMLDVVSGAGMDDALIDGGLMGSPSTEDILGGRGGDGSGTEQDWNYDPSEPRYCICNQVSYGDMVACDNVDVSTCFATHAAKYVYIQHLRAQGH